MLNAIRYESIEPLLFHSTNGSIVLIALGKQPCLSEMMGRQKGVEMNRYGGVDHRTAIARCGSLALVVMLLFVPVLSADGVTAQGSGPVFSNLQVSNNDIDAGSTVFLTVHITSTADIIGNPTASYLLPDGSPGPSVSFSFVGGSLRDGDWQATLHISDQLPDGTYEISELRAANAAGNVTIYDASQDAADGTVMVTSIVMNKLRAAHVMGNAAGDPSENAALTSATSANLTVTHPYPTPSGGSSPHPSCSKSNRPSGPFFTQIIFGSANVVPGDSLSVSAIIVDCDTTYYDFTGAQIVVQYQCANGSFASAGSAAWYPFATQPHDYRYTSTLHLLHAPSTCKATKVVVQSLRAWDGYYNNTFTASHPWWPSIQIQALPVRSY